MPENKRANATFNRTTGHKLGAGFFPAADDARANTRIGVRVDGAFTGTTREILRWTACKWGADEDMVYAQAAKESWWRQSAKGDFGTDASACPPGHGLGVDGQAGQCPQSYGILQDRYPYELTGWPGIASSTAMNADTAYAIWRACFEGYELWLNNVERGAQYGAGDAWGCLGKALAGRWHTAPGDQYVVAVQDYLHQKIWQTPNFQEP
jgi:autotransporter family porin